MQQLIIKNEAIIIGKCSDIGNEAIITRDCSNRYLGLQQKIFGDAAINNRECSK